VSERWPTAWQDGFGVADTSLALTAEELIALREELAEVVERHRTATAQSDRPGRREVALYDYAFPADPDSGPHAEP
jgi:hypothetical protein